METFYLWPGPPPKKCQVCRGGLGTSLVFSDTKEGKRNVAMCERCFQRVGMEKAFYGRARRYVRYAGNWLTASRSDWTPEQTPNGADCTLTDQLRGTEVQFRFDRSKIK